MNNINNYFTQLLTVDVSEHLDKKGQFNYLSWPFAVIRLRTFDETATWEIKRYNELPYQNTEFGTFVEVAVTVKGICLSQIHPVLDSRNQPIKAPTAFDINSSIQRCLVKAIALHGLGLNVYAGEDLPAIENKVNASVTSEQLTKPYNSGGFKETSIDFVPKCELLTSNQLRYINRLIIETNTDIEQLLAYFDFKSLDQIPKFEVNRVIQALESYRKQDVA